MIYVGIDIAQLNHFASAISSDGEELIKPFKFTNDNDGFQIKSIFNETYRNISLYNPCHENVIVMVNIMDAEKTILL